MSEIEKKQDLSSVEYTDVSIGNEIAKPFLTQLKGFWVTFAMMFRKVNTVQYPEVKEPTAPRFHGRHQLNRHPDGLENASAANYAHGLAQQMRFWLKADTTQMNFAIHQVSVLALSIK